LPLPRAVLACCETIQENLLERKLIAEDQVELIRPGFVPAEGPRRLAREDRRIAILADGMDNGIEPMASAMQACQTLVAREMACAFFLMGLGRHENRLRRQARKLPVGRDVTFVGRQPETHYLEIIASGDLYLQVGASDDLPLHTLLAMASGVATIAPAGQVGEFLEDDRTTMLFDEGSPGQISTKLQTALTDRSGTDDRTTAALEYVRDKYSLAEMARRTLAVYHRCRQGR
jgi:glycosyltransferase involved in cell wall biosynthesis